MKSLALAPVTTGRPSRLLLLAAGCLALLGPGAASKAPSISPSVQDSAEAAIRPETRLRKLHLVRPDLIPYPIAYEVYC